MGRRGPPPKPTALRQLTGNAGKRAMNKEEPLPPAGPIKVPTWLKGKGRTFWRQIEPLLVDMKVMTTADPQALALLCDVLAEYVEARALVRQYGMTYESHTVTAHTRRVLNAEEDPYDEEDPLDPNSVSIMIRPRPEVRIASDAWRRARAMMQEFGLTPSARTRVKGDAPDEEDDFGAMFGGQKRA